MATSSAASVEVGQEAGALILRLCGELDLAGRDTVEPAIMAALPTACGVILDLGDLTLCDSSGVAMFLAAHQKAEAEGTVLIFANLRPSVARVFKTSGIHDVLNVTE